MAKPRRQLAIAAVVLHYVLAIGLGTWYNLGVHSERLSASAEVDRYQAELARAGAIQADLAQARIEEDGLAAQRHELYRRVPDPQTVPVIVGQLEAISAAVGGRLVDVSYAPPAWSGRRGETEIRVVFEGSLAEVHGFFASVNATVTSLRWNSLEVVPADARGRTVILYADAIIDVIASRPDGVAAWGPEPVRIVREDVRNVFEVRVPVDEPLPALAVHGLLLQGGRRLALPGVDGVTHLVQPGQTVGGLTVVDVTGDSVVVRRGQRTIEVRLDD